jgi:gluconate 2-dehydrogenase gamma chain
MRRRHFLTVSASSIGGIFAYSLDRTGLRLLAENKPVRLPLRFFTESEALIVEAVTSRIFPADATGPGAKEAGVVIYVDRQLAGPYGRDRYRYTQSPFEEGGPEFGYQGKANPQETYREGLKNLQDFDKLSPEHQDERLKQIESSHFFSLLRQHTIEGMFCDPMHGGNADLVGWKLTGFPGPRMDNRDDVDKHYGEEFRPSPVSLIGGRPMEDEK